MLGKSVKKSSLFLLLLFFININANNDKTTYSVIINGLVTSFTGYVCQSASNNSHTLDFNVSPVGNLQVGNMFILEMSTNFSTDPIITIPQSTVNISGGQFQMTFSFPANTYGSNYKLRVRSTAPAATSTLSNAFEAYDLVHNQEIKLNTAQGIDNIAYCTGSSINLYIYDSGTSTSPLFYPHLTYKWYRRVGVTDTFISGGSNLTVSSPGQYFVRTDYGSCSQSSYSQSRLVTVTESGSNSVAISTSPPTNLVCETTGVLLSLNVSNSTYTYQWYRDGSPISGATSNTYMAYQGGTYKADVDNGSCVATSNNYTLTEITFNASVNLTSPYELAVGAAVNMIITTDANTPNYKWYRNNFLLTETSNTLNITQTGLYKVEIKQTVGCQATKEIEVNVIEPSTDVIPNLISPNGDGINDIFKLPYELIASNNLMIEIYNSSGQQIYFNTNYQNNWPENNDEVFKSKAFFYYKLSKENEVIKEGILTVIK